MLNRPGTRPTPPLSPVLAGRGFSLTEVLIVVAVLSLIVALVLPAYNDSVRRTRRADARVLLVDLAARLERCHAECNSYAAGACPAACPAFPASSPEGYYAASDVARTANAFTLRADPVAGTTQAADAACTAFILTHLEVRTATGTLGNACW